MEINEPLFELEGQALFPHLDEEGNTIGWFSFPQSAYDQETGKFDMTRAIGTHQ